MAKIKSFFEPENIQTQYRVLGYAIDLHVHDYKLTIEVYENGYSDRGIDYGIKRKKAIEQELGCEFIRTGPDKENFDIFETINEVLRHIKQLPNHLTKQ